MTTPREPAAYRAITASQLEGLPALERLAPEVRRAMRVVAAVLPFRVSAYVVEQLIDWDRVPDDPIFRLTFPQPEMLAREDFRRIDGLLRNGAPARAVREAASAIRRRLNPHPGGQLQLNVPTLDDQRVAGVQHKYRETVLYFPASGQTCHAYCTYCFRWAQFVGDRDLRFASARPGRLFRYVAEHPEVTSVLITGGDPMVMKAEALEPILEGLLSPELEHVQSIRIGTKALAYWPYRFTTAPDADDLLRLFERVRERGRHLALMSHYSHPRELEPPVAREALRRVQDAGAVVRCQAPLIRHVNDDPEVWAELWNQEVRLGAVPYYLFVERDTGPRDYFAVPLARALRIYQTAIRRVGGLARTVRGPSMSATPGKILVSGTAELSGERVFVLEFLQARDPAWVGRPFFARFDPRARWIDELRPAFGEDGFFFEKALARARGDA